MNSPRKDGIKESEMETISPMDEKEEERGTKQEWEPLRYKPRPQVVPIDVTDGSPPRTPPPPSIVLELTNAELLDNYDQEWCEGMHGFKEKEARDFQLQLSQNYEFLAKAMEKKKQMQEIIIVVDNFQEEDTLNYAIKHAMSGFTRMANVSLIKDQTMKKAEEFSFRTVTKQSLWMTKV